MKFDVIILLLAILFILLAVGYILLYNRLHKLYIKVEESSSDIDVALEKRFDLLSEEIEAVKKYLSHEYKLFIDVTTVRTGASTEETARQQQMLTEEALKTIDEQIARQAENMAQIQKQLTRSSLRRDQKQRKSHMQAEKKDLMTQQTSQYEASINQKINLLASAHRDLADVEANVDALTEQYPHLCSWISMDQFQRSIFNSEEHLQAARRLYNANASLYNQTLACIPWSLVGALCRMEKAPFYEVEDHKRSFPVRFE